MGEQPGDKERYLRDLSWLRSNRRYGRSEPLRGRAMADRVLNSFPRSHMPRIDVLLVDDHAPIRAALRSVLECCPDVNVIGEAGNGRDAIDAVETLKPAIVVMDISMPMMNGIEATARILARHPHIAIIGLSVDANPEQLAAMTRAGATLLLLKDMAGEQLHSAITLAVHRQCAALN
jgi:DNA-binding NarL/FixJ family response regulator